MLHRCYKLSCPGSPMAAMMEAYKEAKSIYRQPESHTNNYLIEVLSGESWTRGAREKEGEDALTP